MAAPPAPPPLAVHVVDDDEPLLRALTLLLESSGRVVRAHASAEDFLKTLEVETTGCVVADVRMPGMSGLELQEALARRGADVPIIVITGHGDVPMAVQALKGGALDFLQKPFGEEQFLQSVAAAMDRAERTRAERDTARTLRERAALLTPREREVMQLVVEGSGNQAIAEGLGISIRTVEAHRAAVMAKMQAQRVSDLVRMALTL
ncbi:MAG: response regulator transcription factor [Proteobacteria bacterium]|nr:response regulator transcription factor [Pseudomonadota bacterium]